MFYKIWLGLTAVHSALLYPILPTGWWLLVTFIILFTLLVALSLFWINKD